MTPETSDVLQMVDLRDRAQIGIHDIRLETEGDLAVDYQVIGKYYLPWKPSDGSRASGLSIRVSYDRTDLTVRDLLKVTAHLRNHGSQRSPMVIADLGVPPGFTVLTSDFDAMRARGTIARYERRGRQVLLYLRGLEPDRPLDLGYRLKARFPLRARTPASAVYEYYNPQVRAQAMPRLVRVRP